jgi:pimeloyl-ACP methyl ester carboxylesterase
MSRLVPAPARRLVRPLAFAFAIPVVLWLLLSFAGERLVLHPFRFGDGPTPAAYGMAYRNVAFRDSAGIELRGWWIPGRARATVVMVHGWTSSRQETLSKSGYLHAAGYNILVFDLRGHGTSGGSYTTLGYLEPADVHAAVSQALALAPGEPVALIGYSMGASTAVEEAASDPRVAAVVEDSGFAYLSDAVSAYISQRIGLPAWPLDAATLLIGQLDLHFNISKVRPIDAAARLRVPLLAIVGTGDRTVPPVDGFELYRAVRSAKQLLVIPGAGHVDGYWADRTLYTATVLRFLSQSLRTA